MQPSFELAEAVRLLNLAVAQKAAGNLEGALAGLLRARELAPGLPEAAYNLGNLLMERGEPAAAMDAYRRALDVRPDWPQAWNALGTALRHAGDLEASAATHRRAVALAPGWCEAHHNLAVTLQRLGREAEAEEGFRRAIELAPEATESHVSLGLLLLKRGCFRAGWREFDWRFADGGAPVQLRGRPQPVWRGEPLAGRTLLLWAEQGSGSQIQFLRFVPRLTALGGRVVVEAAANLRRLFASCPGIEKVISLNEPCDEADLQIPLLSVPGVLGTTLETLPAEVPYLSSLSEPQPDLDVVFAPYVKDFKIGIAWSGNPHHSLNRDRSCSPVDFATLTDIPGVRLFSLQYGDEGAAPGELSQLGVVSLAGLLGDFASTAAVMERLDLILTVDTYTAHLAGAVLGAGRPVWTLLHTPCDWRWMAGRDDSPWYPGMRLFRQESPGDWPGVFRRVRAALAA
ncbi:MAG: tetratricopeptide repeat-containing glycosyltransferase family protein [Thermoanaerobaculia bacterium]